MLPLKDILASSVRSETHQSPDRRSRPTTSTGTNTHSMPYAHQPHGGPVDSTEHRRPFAQPPIGGPASPPRPQNPGIQSLLHAASASLCGGESSTSVAAQQPPEPSAKNTQSIASTPAPSSKRRVPDSSRSPSPAAKRREGRPAYRPEEDDFIRFCRDDLCQSWECSTKLFNQTWHWDGTTRPRKIPGLQSRYYRLLEESVRDRKKATCGRPELGILEKTNRRYWWMTGAFTEEERAEFEKWRASKAEHGSEPELRMDTSGSYSSEGREDEQEEEEEDETSPLQSDEEDHLMQESNSPMPPSNQQSETGDQDDDDFHPHLMVPIAVSSATTDEEDQHDLSNAVAIAKALKMRRQIPYGRIELSPESADLMSSLRAPCKAGSTRVARRIKSRKRHRKGSTDEQSQGSEGWGDRTQMTDEGIEFLMPSRESNS